MIKKLFTAVLTLLGFSLYSQIDCTIYPGDTTVCYKERINLYTEFSDTLNYYWEPGGETSVIIQVQVLDTTTYYLTVTNKSGDTICSNSITIYTYPKMVIEFEQVNKGCPNECKSQVIATASGGFPPYRYLWASDVAPNDSSLALGLCSDDGYDLIVIDTVCLFDTSYTVETFSMPDIKVTISPDTLYTVNPKATLSFENLSADSIALTNWVWVFSDSTTTNEMMPTHVFVSADTSETKTDTVLLIYTTDDGCTDTIKTIVQMKEFKLDIPNVFTPNGDGINDRFEIPNLERYIRNEFIIFNRWGSKIYETSNYNNDWDGGNMPDGTYFYILRCYGYYKEEVFRGVITIFGSRY